MSEQQTHHIHLNDSRTKISFHLEQANEAGVLTPVPLSGMTVKIKLVAPNQTVVLAETTSGITVVNASNGDVDFDYNGVLLTAGDYYGYVLVYSGARSDHFPVNKRELRIRVHDD